MDLPLTRSFSPKRIESLPLRVLPEKQILLVVWRSPALLQGNREESTKDMSNAEASYLDKLVGLSVEVEISEPWNFETENGPGPLAAAVEDARNSEVLLRLEVPVRVGGKHCNHLIASARYEGHCLLELLQGSTVTVSITAISIDDASTDDLFKLASWKGGMGLIGSIRKK